MSQNKSAKDIAFDKERAKFRQEIKNLQSELRRKDNEITRLTRLVDELEEKLSEKDEWIERLLQYTEISKEELKELIKSEAEKNEANQRIATMFGLYNSFLNGHFR